MSRADAPRCFVCGPDNPIGLGIRFRLDGEFCRGEFTPSNDHCGFDGQTHGGILYSALDDVMANWLFLRGARGHTARCEMRYRQPLPTGAEVLLEARLTKLRGKLAQLEGRAVRADDSSLVAQCQASFMITDPGPPGALEYCPGGRTL